MRRVGRGTSGRRPVRVRALRREAKAETVAVKTPRPRERPGAWPSGCGFSSGTGARALHLSPDQQALGGPAGSGRHPLHSFLGCGLGVGTGPGGGDRGSPPTATPPARHLPEQILSRLCCCQRPGRSGAGLPGSEVTAEWAYDPPSASNPEATVPSPAAGRHGHVCLALTALTPKGWSGVSRGGEGECSLGWDLGLS